jgi:hypothetical protein
MLPTTTSTPAKRLSGLEVVQQDVQALGLLAVVLDNDTRASDNLSGVTLSVDLGQTGPGTQDLGVGDLDEVDVVLGAKSLDQLDVFGWRAISLCSCYRLGIAYLQCRFRPKHTSGPVACPKPWRTLGDLERDHRGSRRSGRQVSTDQARQEFA